MGSGNLERRNTEIPTSAETNEAAAVPPLAAEGQAEVTEAIGAEEARLDANLIRNQEVLSAANARLGAAGPQQPESKAVLTNTRIDHLFKENRRRIENLGIAGFSTGMIGTVIGMVVANTGPNPLMDADALEKAQHALELGRHIAEGGIALSLGSVAVAGIAETLNWLQKRSRINARYE